MDGKTRSGGNGKGLISNALRCVVPLEEIHGETSSTPLPSPYRFTLTPTCPASILSHPEKEKINKKNTTMVTEIFVNRDIILFCF